MNFKSKMAAAVAFLVVVLAVGAFYLTSNANVIVKAAIEKYGTELTQSPTTLDKVTISLSSGQGTLETFAVKNPEGYSQNNALSFAKASLLVDGGSVASDGPIIIKEILVDAPELTYEVAKNGDTNLGKLQRNIENYIKDVAQKNQPTGSETPDEKTKREGRKIIIKQILITKGRIKLRHALYADRTFVDAALPTVSLTNIGQNNGARPAEIARQVFGQLSAKAIAAGQKGLVDNLRRQGLESLKGAIKESDFGKTFNDFMMK